MRACRHIDLKFLAIKTYKPKSIYIKLNYKHIYKFTEL